MTAVQPEQNSIFDAPIVTIIVLFLVLIGGVDVVIDGHLSGDFEKYVETVAWIVGPLAFGRGLAARKAG
jgi:hypothetical protein